MGRIYSTDKSAAELGLEFEAQKVQRFEEQLAQKGLLFHTIDETLGELFGTRFGKSKQKGSIERTEIIDLPLTKHVKVHRTIIGSIHEHKQGLKQLLYREVPSAATEIEAELDDLMVNPMTHLDTYVTMVATTIHSLLPRYRKATESQPEVQHLVGDLAELMYEKIDDALVLHSKLKRCHALIPTIVDYVKRTTLDVQSLPGALEAKTSEIVKGFSKSRINVAEYEPYLQAIVARSLTHVDLRY